IKLSERRREMNLKFRKTLFLSLGLAGTFLLCAGLTNSAAVYAQSWRSQCPTTPQEWQRREAILRSRGWDGRLNNNGNVDLNRNGIDDRCEVGLFQGDRFEYDRYGNRNYRNDPYNSPYNRGNENYGYNSEVQRGY